MTRAGITLMIIISALLFCISITVASDCGCDAEPPGGWGPPDYTNDPSWGSSFDDLTGGGDSSADTGSSGGSGAADGGSGSDPGSGGSTDSDSSSGSTSSGGSSGTMGGSAEEGVVWRMKADDLALKGSYNESLVAYEKSITYDPYTLKAWIGKGKVLLALDRPADAADAFIRAIRLDPSNTDGLILLGDALNASGSFEDAIASYTRALAMNPNLAGVEDKIALSETAKIMVDATVSSDEAAVAVVTMEEDNTIQDNETIQVTSSEPPTASATHSATFAGVGCLLVAFGAGFVLLRNKKQ
jgi:tetratricopeptide (TPR) repeat protein